MEISCDQEKVKEIVERVLSSLDTKDEKMSGEFENEISQMRKEINLIKEHLADRSVGRTHTDKPAKVGMTCRGLIETLWSETFFSSERPLGEVHDELARRGYNYDRTAVSHSLSDLVREGLLSRIGTMRNYRYVKKRPPDVSRANERRPLLS